VVGSAMIGDVSLCLDCCGRWGFEGECRANSSCRSQKSIVKWQVGRRTIIINCVAPRSGSDRCLEFGVGQAT
jgi:hypothetical protein